MAVKRKPSSTSREEDYRDYDTRNIDEGWPYADAAGAGAKPVENAAYGDPSANFDRERNRGYHVDGVDADGREDRLQDSVRPATKGLEEADDLEERVSEAIENLDDVTMDAIDLHADQGTVTIEGTVDDAALSRRIAATVEGVAGVRRVVNNLQLAGVDSHIPDDD
ncbi:BON domain-containing protein [Neorhizobium sp. T786]|uniref:BON domain-containing protein n=1 Tax=Pseudorhizobium xiangyangii TaxID=2883104 RepID=UPI001CFF649A|nr:BON domain-containing protein [Neorhizobium xiangyangii]MCB5202067.1 BON domain-containing protein [Neorhizobium xiangyangii]